MCEKDERSVEYIRNSLKNLIRVMWRDCMGENNDENLKKDLMQERLV